MALYLHFMRVSVLRCTKKYTKFCLFFLRFRAWDTILQSYIISSINHVHSVYFRALLLTHTYGRGVVYLIINIVAASHIVVNAPRIDRASFCWSSFIIIVIRSIYFSRLLRFAALYRFSHISSLRSYNLTSRYMTLVYTLYTLWTIFKRRFA